MVRLVISLIDHFSTHLLLASLFVGSTLSLKTAGCLLDSVTARNSVTVQQRSGILISQHLQLQDTQKDVPSGISSVNLTFNRDLLRRHGN